MRRSRCPHICVLNTLVAEYNYETDIAVQRAEEREIAFAEGIERGIEQGISQGIEQGISRGSYQTKLEMAKNLIDIGLSVENIAKATGLSREEIAKL